MVSSPKSRFPYWLQIVGERNVRIVPDVAVNGTGGSNGLVDGLLGIMGEVSC